MSAQQSAPNPFHPSALGISLVEFYRRLLIAIVKESGGNGAVKGIDLININAKDGLILHFTEEGISLRTENATDHWEAHVGTPGSRDPESWVVPNRPHLNEQPPARSAEATDARLAELERKMAAETVERVIVEGDAGTRGTRIPFYTAERPKSRSRKEEPTQ